jgi:uncharacterized LabA/DUF88 family protein
LKKKENNYAFIDGQNTYLGAISMGWKIDWARFRVYLKEKYYVSVAYIFIGYIPSRNDLYKKLQQAGFILIFKPTIPDSKGNIKGNCDADLVLHTLVEKDNYDKAIIVSSDGDFYSLVRYLNKINKLKIVLSSNHKNCSSLLRNESKGRVFYLQYMKNKISK